jgi:pimeloyl-ACP methyl ester carboxylesterase
MKVKIKTEKALLSANFYIPLNKNYKKLAIILPGFLDSKDYKHYSNLGKFLATKDYLSVIFDPAGTWESGNDMKIYSMSQYLSDIDDVVNYAKDIFKKDFEEIIIIGHSLGGRIALIYAARNENISKAIGLMASNISPIKWNKREERLSKRDYPGNKDMMIQFKVPFSFVEDAMKYDLLSEVSKINVPILLIAGENDEPERIESLKSIYEQANDLTKFVLMKGFGHNYRDNKDQMKKMNEEIWQFISDN